MADTMHYRLIDGSSVKAIPMNALPPEAWNPPDLDGNDSEIDRLAAKVAFMFRCIEVRSSALESVPWAVMRGETEVWTSDETDQPTGLQYQWLPTVTDQLGRIEEALVIGSKAYLFKARNRMRLLELQWLTPFTMTPVWSKDEPVILRYERRIGRDRPPINFEPDEVVYIWLLGQHETEPKSSPVKAAMSAAGVLFNVDEFAKQFFGRGAIKATILAVPQNTQPKDKKELESWFQRAMTGISKAWSSKAINADAVTAIPIGEGLESLANNNLTEAMREDIATAMGVPHSLVLSNAANYATAEVDEQGFYDRTVLPECKRIQNALNEQLFRPEGLRLVFRPEQMSIYQEDEEQRATALLQYVQAGMPLNVAVQVLGIDLPDDAVTALSASPPVAPEQPNQEREEEAARFRRWAQRRMNSKSFDPAQFESNLLSDDDKTAIVAGLRGDGAAVDAPFPALAWADYP